MLKQSTSTSGSEHVPGLYYDGRSAAKRRVDLSIDPAGRLRIEGDGIAAEHSLDAVRLQPAIANLPRLLLLPDGAQCEIADAIEFDQLIAPRLGSGSQGWVHRLESRSAYVIAAVVILAVVVYLIVVRGVPFLASVVAAGINPSMEAGLSDQSLAALDNLVFEPSKLSPARRLALRQRFEALRKADSVDFAARLEFRTSPETGPNAFTLPGGTIVLLDELVTFALNDDEVAAVLCHELAHVRHRHILRTALQNAGVVVLLGAIFGDVFSGASFAAALPLAAVQSSYSRDFEREADEYAVSLMSELGVNSTHYVKLLERFDRRERAATERYPDFLATHPPNAERIEALKKTGR